MKTIYMDIEILLPRYYPLPQFLLELDISSTSKLLYALLLNRANHLYIKIPSDVELVSKPPVIQSGKWRKEGQKSTTKKARYPTANNYNKSPNYYNRLISEIDYSFEEGESL